MILRPLDRSRGNHKVWYELTNRGSVLAFQQLNDAISGGNDPSKAADAGSGFLMRQGYSLLFSGWDATAAPGDNRFTMKAPISESRWINYHRASAGGIQYRQWFDDQRAIDLPGRYSRQVGCQAHHAVPVRG